MSAIKKLLSSFVGVAFDPRSEAASPAIARAEGASGFIIVIGLHRATLACNWLSSGMLAA